MVTLINWSAIHAEIEAEQKIMQQLVQRVESYVETLPHTGLVYTRLEKELERGQFLVWVDKGIYVDHKYIQVSELGE